MSKAKNLEILNNKHKNKVAYIIGAGPSILSVDFSKITNGISIAINSGYCAYPQSDYFVSDDWSCANWSYMFKDLKTSHNTKALLYDQKFTYATKWFGERTIIFKHRKGWHLNDTYSHSVYQNYICQARTSLITGIAIAHIMGCSPIVLLGVDCYRKDNKRYFWQFWPKEKQPYRNDGVPIERYQVLKSREIDTDLLDVLKYWDRSGKEIKKTCLVLNASPNSNITIFKKITL